MQICEIVLYSRDGRKRTLVLHPGKVNIITGRSHTGKSALIYIVSYCLGGTSCHVPEGRILEAVAWFGILLDLGKERLFVARQNPYPGQQSTSRAFLARGARLESPSNAPSEPNTPIDALESTLNGLLGVSPNLHVPPIGQTRTPLSANIRHALFYCFQHQTEIATNQFLFHRQSEDFLTQTIKDTLPYFLGAVREDDLALVQELARVKRELRLLEQRQRENESIRGEGVSRARSLLTEAENVGLVASTGQTTDLQQIRSALSSVVEWQPNQPTFSGADVVIQIQDELNGIEIERRIKTDAIRTAKAFAQEARGFSTEAKIQASRLESIGLFEAETHNSATCPLCQQNLAVPTPNAEAIRKSFDQLHTDLETVVREQPRLREYIENLENELGEIIRRRDEKQEALNNLLSQQVEARRMRDMNVRRGMVVGRISLWLQSIPETTREDGLAEAINAARVRVTELVGLTSSDDKEDRLASMLNRISSQMTEWAKRLRLEFSECPIRLDLTNVTVVVDRPERPVPLKRLGSGDNWVGYHLVTHLALHRHFCRDNRPVPHFLFLDQPTQAFFPADRDTEMQGQIESIPRDHDREQVRHIFRLIFDAVAEIAPEFQVIVTDHADLKDEEFQSAVVERWRADDSALVPDDWPGMQLRNDR